MKKKLQLLSESDQGKGGREKEREGEEHQLRCR